jgi:hypothetical protein
MLLLMFLIPLSLWIQEYLSLVEIMPCRVAHYRTYMTYILKMTIS